MYSTIHHADDVVLSSKQRSKYTKLKVSEKTKGLCGKDTKKQFKSVQSEIVKSSLSDFEACVEEWVNAISAANRLGDTCKVYKAVEVLAEKQDTPPINITTDNKGKLLSVTSVEEVTTVRGKFLSVKFATINKSRDGRALVGTTD